MTWQTLKTQLTQLQADTWVGALVLLLIFLVGGLVLSWLLRRAIKLLLERDRDQRIELVYLPTSPIPMSGGLLFVAEEAVSAVPGMELGDLMKIYFSPGALMPDDGKGGLSRVPLVARSP